ncbi:sentrin-specific protease 2-like isoform 2-T2 [Porphyrio hochstetteri]
MVINFYMALLVDRSNRKKGPSVFAFNTFFYLKLCSGGYSAVKRWSKGVDLFTKDIIFVPVHLSSPWTLGVIDVRKKSVRHYDSLGQNGAEICQVLLKFLQEESLEKRKVELDCSEWTLCTMEPHEIPQQKKGSD